MEVMMGQRDGWVEELWRMLEGVFDFPWNAHLRALNARLGLVGDQRFATHSPGMPPAWFNGDLEAFEGNRWVLVVSLNPHRTGEPETPSEPQFDRTFTLAEYWDFWRTYNTNYWYRRFYGPLARVAAGALGEDLSRDNERAFATERMLFLELCPYASARFSLRSRQIKDLVDNDPGFHTARDMLHLAAGQGHPALILVNGNAAVAALDASDSTRVQWSSVITDSASRSGRRLRHWEGSYRTEHGSVPIAGFPFLRAQSSFNSHAEIAQLIAHLCALVGGVANN